MKISVLFIFFLCLISITWKLYGAYKYYTYQTTALLPGIFLFWFGAMHELPLVSYSLKTVSKDTSHFCLSTSGACVYVLWVWPHPDYWTHVLQAATNSLGCNKLIGLRQVGQAWANLSLPTIFYSQFLGKYPNYYFKNSRLFQSITPKNPAHKMILRLLHCSISGPTSITIVSRP